ncbi:glycosyltransferase family 4 protein [soil metagenome]
MLESVVGLIDSGHDVTVALPNDGPLSAELRHLGATVAICRMPILRKSALKPLGMLRLMGVSLASLLPSLRLLRRSSDRTVYVSTLTIPSWVILGRLMRRHVVCHVHEAERSASSLVRRLMATPLLAAHALVLNSEFSRSVLSDSLPSLNARCTVVYNAVVGPDDPPAPRATLTPPVQLVYVGRLSERKGVDLVVDATAILRERGTLVHLRLVGAVFEGYEWYEDQLHAQVARLGLEEQVEFTGFLPSIWDVMSTADIAVVPSRADEPFGNTAVESVLARVPCIVSDSSGLREASAGYRGCRQVEVDSAAAIADAVEDLTRVWEDMSEITDSDREAAAHKHSLATYRAEIVRIVAATA